MVLSCQPVEVILPSCVKTNYTFNHSFRLIISIQTNTGWSSLLNKNKVISVKSFSRLKITDWLNCHSPLINFLRFRLASDGGSIWCNAVCYVDKFLATRHSIYTRTKDQCMYFMLEYRLFGPGPFVHNTHIHIHTCMYAVLHPLVCKLLFGFCRISIHDDERSIKRRKKKDTLTPFGIRWPQHGKMHIHITHTNTYYICE